MLIASSLNKSDAAFYDLLTWNFRFYLINLVKGGFLQIYELCTKYVTDLSYFKLNCEVFNITINRVK